MSPGLTPPPNPNAEREAQELAKRRVEAAKLVALIEEQGKRLDILAERYNVARQEAAAADARGAAAARALDEARRDEEAARERVRQDAVRAYVGSGSSQRVPSALRASGDREAASAEAYTRALLNRVKARADDLSRKRAVSDDAARAADSARQQAHEAAARAKIHADSAAEALRVQHETLTKIQGDLVGLVAEEETRLAAEVRQRYLAAIGSMNPGPLPPPNTPRAAAAVAAASQELGKPYLWGGTGPAAFDCSGLMLIAYRAAGVGLPRVAEDQRQYSTPIPASALAPGDLVFFGLPAHHVGMYVGNDLMIEAPHTGAFVRYSSIWRPDVSFGRIP